MNLRTRQKIRTAYKNNLNDIFAQYPYSDPYFFDWNGIMTPIEDELWSYIRFFGLPFYPQFPIEGYFLDFADPVKKIAIEADGAMYHKDLEHDAIRQKEIEKLEWRFYRITGSDIVREVRFQCEQCHKMIENINKDTTAYDFLSQIGHKEYNWPFSEKQKVCELCLTEGYE